MNKLVRISLAAAAVVLAGCSPNYNSLSMPVLPDELKDCKFYIVTDGIRELRVVRCPNSTTSTTYSSGKTSRTDVVIDGVTYRPVEK